MKSKIKIREYHSKDRNQILNLLKLNTPKYFAPKEENDLIYYLDNEIELYYVVETDNIIVGCGGINFEEYKTIGKISWDIFHPEYQGKSLGSLLVKYRIEKLNSIETIKAITVRTSQLAFKFYKKQGFGLLEIVKDYWAKGLDLYKMEYEQPQKTIPKIAIRRGIFDDLEALQKLFVDTISTVCKMDYSEEQISVWTSNIENKERWQNILANQFVLVAQENEKITGFCTLDNGNYIDLFYVHKDHQQQGIAKKLYADIEKEAKRQGQTELTSNVSKTARPFFEKIGFNVKKEQIVNIKGVELTNYKMTKPIA